ncbi:MAG: hypothetical protein HC830_10330 [Bacteroidetes bacterium]|nr:hypothetical protein [Bacteroidota bacterium]
MNTFFRKRWYIFIPVIILAIAAFGFLTMALWNYLMPSIFNLPAITFWQAIGLLVLARILFGCGPRPSHPKYAPWSGHFRDKLARMTPEEREAFYQKWNSRCYTGFRRETPSEE